MNTFLVLLSKELFEQSRTKKLLIIGFIFIFFALLSPITAKITPQLLKQFSAPGMSITLPEPTYLDSLDQFMKNVGQLTIFILLFVVSGAVADEKNRKTLEMVLVKPLTRSAFITAKFLSYFLSVTGLFALGTLIFYYYTITVFSSFSFVNLSIIFLLTTISLLTILTITILFSTVSRSNLAAAGIGFLSFIALAITGALLPKFEKYSPIYVLGKYRQIITDGWTADYLPSLLIGCGIIIACILLAINFFNKQEVER